MENKIKYLYSKYLIFYDDIIKEGKHYKRNIIDFKKDNDIYSQIEYIYNKQYKYYMREKKLERILNEKNKKN